MSTLTDWIPDVSDFAARLVLVRHEMGWNLKEAALACDVKAQSWREWELENRKPRDYEAVCHKIADTSGCSLVWLMTGIAPPARTGGPGVRCSPGTIRTCNRPDASPKVCDHAICSP